MYNPPRDRVISQSTPAIGACLYAWPLSASVNPPPLMPQNHAFLKPRPCCAVLTAGNATTIAIAIVRGRLIRIRIPRDNDGQPCVRLHLSDDRPTATVTLSLLSARGAPFYRGPRRRNQMIPIFAPTFL